MFIKEGNDIFIDTKAKPKTYTREQVDTEYQNCKCTEDFLLLGYDSDISVIKCLGCGEKSYIP